MPEFSTHKRMHSTLGNVERAIQDRLPAANAFTRRFRWHSKETGYWMLGVFSGNQRIDHSHVATLGTYTGQPSFDLYCNDSGWFKSGQHFLVEVTLIDSSSAKQVLRLP